MQSSLLRPADKQDLAGSSLPASPGPKERLQTFRRSPGSEATHLCTSQSQCLAPVSPFPWCYIQGTDATPARLTSPASWRAGRRWSSGFRTRSPPSLPV